MNVSDLAGRLRDLRFDGYTDTGIATEIERFRSGDGTGSIGIAVEALKSVAGALADTDKTLRDELGKLGVEWQSEAGGAAGQVFTEQAGFSQDANSKVSHSAEMIFAQGEAFNRTLHKLPDPETVRKGAGGLTIGDVVLSLIGFETDHAKSVSAANNARAQAQEALNDYAKTSGENLLTTDTLADPQAMNLTQNTTAASAGGGPGPLNLAGTATDLTPDGSVRPASAAVESKYVPPPVQTAGNPKAPSYDAPTPAYGVAMGGGVARKTGASAPSQGGATVPAAAAPTTPSGTSRPTPAPGSGWVTPNRPTPQPETGRPSYPVTGSPASPPFVPPGAPNLPAGSTNIPPGQSTGSLPPSSTTSAQPFGKSFGPGPGAESALGKGPGSTSGPGVFGGVGGGTGGGDQGLGKGRSVGAGPQAPMAPGNESGRGFPAIPKVTGPAAGDLGAGAAALGAGVAGGALSGDKERDRRPRQEGGAVKPTRQLPIGELPEEEAMRRSEKIGAKQPKPESKFMERAATQDVDEDAEHIRRYGVDDKDLFTDERMVSPDVIGDHGNREAR
ncbi:PPE domain-containing protein [Amycolatopsis azurea]|uniref:PPE family domain-containing protein n=1 Tax=Amycolatopsis azurea DSM 43854 TaxID=1238180 RepID=M2QS89_9PSEU|nr:PPE domain-containing protein [Amycolatopsis azurea]EMD28797.1 hypothetical protein C791_7574 [Amycolatopsis azurea DSM 43854]OOC04072.1 hypothetical protein B0293_24365 [Amycolatopsis azurea DSM 43854]